VRLLSSKRRVVMAAAILLVLFLARPGVSRLKARIANSISRAVARPVEIGSVHLRFLPPGFDLENLVVGEDPSFGAEPMLRSSEVTARVRLSSLLRGRLDVSRLELTEPSLNLVRRADGQWNLEELLEHTARTPTAPTAKSKSEVRPGFPYIEASSGRINFKSGAEKKPYALLDADFALWQESEDAWGVRLKAQPLRTDTNLNNAGVLLMNGTWQRAPTLRDTPLQFNLEWSQAPLGQLTKLIWGDDEGWRGEVRLDAALNGTPAALQIATDASINDFHRYDISSMGGMRLQGHCDGKYSSVEQVTHQIFCSLPVGTGMITLHGDAGLPGVHRMNLSLELSSVPVSAAAELARRAKKSLPTDLVATGGIQGDFVAREDETSSQRLEFEGQGEITDLRLQSPSNKADVSPGTVPFVLVSGNAKKSSRSYLTEPFVHAASGVRLEYGPFSVALGRAAPAKVQGWFGISDYGLTLRGEGEISHTLRLASLLGLAAIKANTEGMAQVDLAASGSWTNGLSQDASGFSPPQVTGKVQLHNVHASVHGVNEPIEIVSAELLLSKDEARIDKLSAHAGNARWTGFVSLPRGCGAPGACVANFELKTDQVTLSGLHDWLRPPGTERRWYQVLASEPAPASFLQNLRAKGRVSAGRLMIHNVAAKQVSATLDVEKGTLNISDLRADVLGGKHSGRWQIDFSAGTPVYTGDGTLTAISLEQMADAMHDSWISGTANGSYQLKASGNDSASFWKSAEAALQFEVWDGDLSHIVLNADDPPLRIGGWRGHAQLQAGKLQIAEGKLISPSGLYDVSGTASLGQELDFKIKQGSESTLHGSMLYSVTGTLAEPRVGRVAQPQTQAKLKRQ
jgi:AsmA family/AsmA-like C-terminal region